MPTENLNPLPGQKPATQVQGEMGRALAEDEMEGPPSLVREFLWFLKDNKKWWLIPLIVIFVILGLLILAGTNPALAPFLYTLV